MVAWIIWAAWAWCVGVVAGGECVIDGDVAEPDNTKQKELLNILSPLMGIKWDAFQGDDRSKYYFELCGDVLPSRPNVTLVQRVVPTSTSISLGLYNRTLVTSDKHWMMLTFLGGDKYNETSECGDTTRKAHVLFICDHRQKEPIISVLNDSEGTLNCVPTFIVRNRVVCYLSDPGLSGWSIFFIIILVSFGGYFIFGFFYLRLVKGAKGVEQIPNRPFWFRVGNMMADGCGTVFRCDRYCGGTEVGVGGAPTTSSSYSGYSPIEDRLVQDLQEPDRDATLLNP